MKRSDSRYLRLLPNYETIYSVPGNTRGLQTHFCPTGRIKLSGLSRSARKTRDSVESTLDNWTPRERSPTRSYSPIKPDDFRFRSAVAIPAENSIPRHHLPSSTRDRIRGIVAREGPFETSGSGSAVKNEKGKKNKSPREPTHSFDARRRAEARMKAHPLATEDTGPEAGSWPEEVNAIIELA